MKALLRFQFVSLLVAVLVTGGLLGLSVAPRVEQDAWGQNGLMPQTAQVSEDLDYLGDTFGMERLRVSQGWPLTIREVCGLARGSPAYLKRASFLNEWLETRDIDWRAAALNGMAVLLAGITVLIGVEWVLRRRLRSV